MRRIALFAGFLSGSLASTAFTAAAQPAEPPKAAETPAPEVPAAPPSVAAAPPAQQPSQEQSTPRPQEPSPLPPEPPATAPSPVQPKPQVPPLGTSPTSPGAMRDEGASPDGPELAPPESSIGPELFAGMNARLNDNEGFRNADRAGLSFGLGGWLAPNRTYSLGLVYQRTSLGTAQSAPGESNLSARFDLNTVWLGGRAYPLRSELFGVFILLELGASWQNVSASGTRPTASFTVPAQSFACSVTDSPGFALGGGAGIDVDIERQLAFIAQADVSGHRLSSDPIDGCAPGAGSATNLGARIGFLYRFDLDQSPPRPTSARLR
jgi:hypothetical protein